MSPSAASLDFQAFASLVSFGTLTGDVIVYFARRANPSGFWPMACSAGWPRLACLEAASGGNRWRARIPAAVAVLAESFAIAAEGETSVRLSAYSSQLRAVSASLQC